MDIRDYSPHVFWSYDREADIEPVVDTETLVYTKDIDEHSVGTHLCPIEVADKEQIAAFFTGELRNIREEI